MDNSVGQKGVFEYFDSKTQCDSVDVPATNDGTTSPCFQLNTTRSPTDVARGDGKIEGILNCTWTEGT